MKLSLPCFGPFIVFWIVHHHIFSMKLFWWTIEVNQVRDSQIFVLLWGRGFRPVAHIIRVWSPKEIYFPNPQNRGLSTSLGSHFDDGFTVLGVWHDLCAQKDCQFNSRDELDQNMILLQVLLPQSQLSGIRTMRTMCTMRTILISISNFEQ